MGPTFQDEILSQVLCLSSRSVLCRNAFNPYSLIYILGMHKPKSIDGCKTLLEATTATLSEEALQMLLISAQEANIALCVKYAVKMWVIITSHLFLLF